MELTIFRCEGAGRDHHVLAQGQLSPPVRCRVGSWGRRQMNKITAADWSLFSGNMVARTVSVSVPRFTLSVRLSFPLFV